MQKFTGFCQQANGRGTTWIGPVEAENLEEAIHAARAACAADWGWDGRGDSSGSPDDIHVLGIARGKADILFWEDVCDA